MDRASGTHAGLDVTGIAPARRLGAHSLTGPTYAPAVPRPFCQGEENLGHGIEGARPCDLRLQRTGSETEGGFGQHAPHGIGHLARRGSPVRRSIPAPDQRTRAATSGFSSLSPATTRGTPWARACCTPP